VTVLPAGAAGVADIVGAGSLLVSEAALPTLEARCGAVSRGAKGEGG
jgi:hypothetical protein